jgi:divalent metal cation (Fe/Co/Zn/Cd) transporter
MTRHRHTIAGQRSGMSAWQQGDGFGDNCHVHTQPVREVSWLRAAAWAKALAWMSLVWMCAEGALGLWQGFAAGSIALVGWALGSAVEGLASVIVVWRFTGARTLSETVVGMVLAASSLLVMPALGYAKQRLGARLGSAATVGEGVQNYLCAAQAGAVLTGLGVTAAWPGGWWVDPVIGLGIAAWSVWEGIESWRGKDCC